MSPNDVLKTFIEKIKINSLTEVHGLYAYVK